MGLIDQVTAQKFSANLHVLAQQKGSKFASRVRNESCVGYELAYFDTLAAFTAPTQQTTRHGDTPLIEPDFNRRKVTPYKWELGTLLDSYDLKRMQEDPQGAVVQGFANSLGRKKDDIIIDALLGIAYIGKTGASSVAGLYAESGHYDIDGDGTVTDVETLAAAQTEVVMSLGKILLMMQLFNQDDVDPDLPKHWAVAPDDIKTMLDITEVGSVDFNTVKALAQGKVDTFGGFDFFWTNRLGKDAAGSTCRRTIAWATPGLILATIGDINTSIDKRADKKNETQVYSYMDLGAVRMEGTMVHECLNLIS